MERFKELLAFPLYATAIWLVWVLAQQTGASGVALALSGMLALGLWAWLRRHAHGRGLRAAGGLATAAALAALLLAQPPGGDPATAASSTAEDSAPYEAYTPERLAGLRAEGRAVLVNLTAAWCITCLVNERVALSSPAFAAALEQGAVTYLKGDWTSRDPRITELLHSHGRSGVPLYLLYPPGPDAPAEVWPQLLTEGFVLERLERLPAPADRS
jgi:thiol:disulfide interchange protein DsbD